MAEKLKAFEIEKNINDYISSNNNINIYNLNSTTQFVVKGVNVEESTDEGFTIKTNGFTFYEGNYHASGNEILDINSAITTSLNDYETIINTITIKPVQIDSQNKKFISSDLTKIFIKDNINNDILSIETTAPNLLACNDYVINSKGDLYLIYHGHGNPYSTTLYKLTGGPAGAISANLLPSTTYCNIVLAPDKNNAIYYISGDDLYHFNIETDVHTKLTYTGIFTAGGGSSAYSKLFYANNKLFYVKNGNYLSVLDLDTMVSTQEASTSNKLSSSISGCTAYSTDLLYRLFYSNNYYYLIYHNSSNKTFYLDRFDTNFNLIDTKTYTSSVSLVTAGINKNGTRTEYVDNFVFIDLGDYSNIKIVVFDVNNFTKPIFFTMTPFKNYSSLQTQRYFVNPIKFQNESDARRLVFIPQKIKARVCGIEITGVN